MDADVLAQLMDKAGVGAIAIVVLWRMGKSLDRLTDRIDQRIDDLIKTLTKPRTLQ